MKLKQIWMWMATALTALAVGCATPDEEVGLDDGYGYVQFKLYKKASYVAPEDSTKAIVKHKKNSPNGPDIVILSPGLRL